MATRLRSLTESESGDPNLVEGLVSSASFSGTTLLAYRDDDLGYIVTWLAKIECGARNGLENACTVMGDWLRPPTTMYTKKSLNMIATKRF